MRLRSDLDSYFEELRLSGRYSSELVRLVLSHGHQGQGQGRDLHQQFVAREEEVARLRKKYSQLVANHQQLRKDYQKLIGKMC